MSEIKLLPCPCCNGEAEFNEIGTQINCKECGLTLDVSECYEQGFSNARDTMIKKWNTRKPMERIVERLKYEKERHDKDCSYWNEYSWKDELQFNECDMSRKKSECFEEAIEICKEEGRIDG